MWVPALGVSDKLRLRLGVIALQEGRYAHGEVDKSFPCLKWDDGVRYRGCAEGRLVRLEALNQDFGDDP